MSIIARGFHVSVQKNLGLMTVGFATEGLVNNEDGNIVSIGLKDPPRRQIDGRYAGLLKFSLCGLVVIEPGGQVHAKPFHHGWIEFDTNEDYETACKWAESGVLELFVSLL